MTVRAVFAVTLPISHICQRQQNTWPGIIIIHGLVNVFSMVPVLLIISGILH